MNKLFGVISWLTIISALFLMSLIIYWLFCPYEPITLLNQPYKVVNKAVNPGDHVRFYFEYCKKHSISGDLTISFIDGFIYNTPTVKSNIPTGCHKLLYDVYVPKAIPVGNYKIKALLNYQVNPIKSIDIQTSTDNFTVISSALLVK
jgi:hypothetical protein